MKIKGSLDDKAITPLDIGLLVIMLIFSVGLVLVYVSAEHAFYYWDYAAYHNMTVRIAADFAHSPLLALQEVVFSLRNEYNYLFTIPLVFFASLFGTNRSGYILSLTIAFQLPFVLMTGVIASRMINANKRAVFWCAVSIALLMPMAWAPTLRGYPDIVAAFMVMVAVWFFLYDPSLKKWWQYAGMGLGLTAAMLLRRHFIYDAAAFFISITIYVVIISYGSAKNNLAELLKSTRKSLVQVGLILAVTLIALVGLGFPFLIRTFSKNYYLLYSSYNLTSLNMITSFIAFFGLIVWILVILGYSGLIVNNARKEPGAIFISVFGSVSLLIWVFFVRQSATHYTLHLAVFIILGLTAFVWSTWKRIKNPGKMLILSGFSIFMITNSILSLAPVGNLSNWRFLFSKAYPPLIRHDYTEIEDLVSYLRSEAGPSAPIYVAASSSLLNDDLLKNAEATLYKDPELDFVHAPQIDSRDFYPIEPLLNAQFVVTATPFQYSLQNPDEQLVVKSVVDAFSQNWEIASDFALQPIQFKLEDGAIVQVYRRLKPTTFATAIRTFTKIEQYIKRYPGQQSDWIAIEHPKSFDIAPISHQAYRLNFVAGDPEAGQSIFEILYANKEPIEGPMSGQWMSLNPECPPLTISFITTDEQANPSDIVNVFTSATKEKGDFYLPATLTHPNYWLITATPTNPITSTGSQCSLLIEWKKDK